MRPSPGLHRYEGEMRVWMMARDAFYIYIPHSMRWTNPVECRQIGKCSILGNPPPRIPGDRLSPHRLYFLDF